MNNVESDDTADCIGNYNDACDCQWRIDTDYACEQGRNDQKAAANDGRERREGSLPGSAPGKAWLKHEQ